jgi:hypothetical protein
MSDEMEMKPTYEPPVVVPLGSLVSAVGAACKNGVGDTGACKTGYEPGGACNTGPSALKSCVDGAQHVKKNIPGEDAGLQEPSSGEDSGFRVP